MIVIVGTHYPKDLNFTTDLFIYPFPQVFKYNEVVKESLR